MFSINPVVLQLLLDRGITEIADIQEFLAEKPKKTYDPFLLPDMEAGVDLILDAIKQKQRICIYGDYDADGVTSVSVLMEFLGHLTDNIEYYIPLRIEEGYGLNKDAIRTIHEGGVKLLITVDCGSVSYEEVELAKELGMQVLVTDHHSITDVQADCLMINPKRKDCIYPFKDLAGCGVAFKLTQAIQQKTSLPKSVLNRGLDMVALGTIADVVPLLDENRTMVKYGMNLIRSGFRPGLNSLIEGISFDIKKLRSDQIAFGLAPHINAAGRMGDAGIAAQLMLENDPQIIHKQVEQLKQYNLERKGIQAKAFEQCVELVDQYYYDKPILVLYVENLHEGVAGIVAGKLKEKYKRPVILTTDSGDNLKGTGRSIPGINLYELLHTYDHMFLRFGGHEGACGFTMDREMFEHLAIALEEDLNRRLEEKPDLLTVPLHIDMEIEGEQITPELAQALDMMAPFGSKNPKPVFLLEQAELIKIVPMGDGRHIRFTAICSDGYAVDCILFGRAHDFEEKIYSGMPVNLIGTVDCQEWRGRKRIQFVVEDIE